MKPSQVASTLRRIASGIQNSKQPDRRLVARDLKRVLAAMETNILNQSINVDIPGMGSVPVVITQADLISENYWKNVKGTINGISFVTSGGKHADENTELGSGLEGFIGTDVDSYRAIDAVSSALIQILDQNVFGEFPEVKNGQAVPIS